jgi:site-specific DNA-methyltransferase (adenine-specific)
LKEVEEILVFSTNNRSPRYYPQMKTREKPIVKFTGKGKRELCGLDIKEKKTLSLSTFPKSILKFPPEAECFHPTQKPVALLEYLIKTYSLEGEVVLDPCFGSGSTLLAAIKQGRKAIGFEREEEYFNALQVRASKLGVEVKGEEE